MNEEFDAAQRQLDDVYNREAEIERRRMTEGITDDNRQEAWVEWLRIKVQRKQALERIQRADPTFKAHEIAQGIGECETEIERLKGRLGEPWSSMR